MPTLSFPLLRDLLDLINVRCIASARATRAAQRDTLYSLARMMITEKILENARVECAQIYVDIIEIMRDRGLYFYNNRIMPFNK